MLKLQAFQAGSNAAKLHILLEVDADVVVLALGSGGFFYWAAFHDVWHNISGRAGCQNNVTTGAHANIICVRPNSF